MNEAEDADDDNDDDSVEFAPDPGAGPVGAKRKRPKPTPPTAEELVALKKDRLEHFDDMLYKPGRELRCNRGSEGSLSWSRRATQSTLMPTARRAAAKAKLAGQAMAAAKEAHAVYTKHLVPAAANLERRARFDRRNAPIRAATYAYPKEWYGCLPDLSSMGPPSTHSGV